MVAYAESWDFSEGTGETKIFLLLFWLLVFRKLVVDAELLEVGPKASVERENRSLDAIWLRLYRRCEMRPERASVTTCAVRPRLALLHRPLPETSSPGSCIKSGLIQVVNVDHDVLNVLIQPQALRVGNPMKAVDDVKVAAVHSLTRCEE